MQIIFVDKDNWEDLKKRFLARDTWPEPNTGHVEGNNVGCGWLHWKNLYLET